MDANTENNASNQDEGAGNGFAFCTPEALSKTIKPALLRGLVVAVDFDGTCVTHEFPKIGRSIGAESVLSDMADHGAKLILWTMRSGEALADAVRWFGVRNIPLYGVNENPSQKSWTASPKVYAKVYIDDAALGAPLCAGPKGERAYIDWDRVRDHFFPKTESL